MLPVSRHIAGYTRVHSPAYPPNSLLSYFGTVGNAASKLLNAGIYTDSNLVKHPLHPLASLNNKALMFFALSAFDFAFANKAIAFGTTFGNLRAKAPPESNLALQFR